MEFSYSKTKNFEIEKLSSDIDISKTSGDQQGAWLLIYFLNCVYYDI